MNFNPSFCLVYDSVSGFSLRYIRRTKAGGLSLLI